MDKLAKLYLETARYLTETGRSWSLIQAGMVLLAGDSTEVRLNAYEETAILTHLLQTLPLTSLDLRTVLSERLDRLTFPRTYSPPVVLPIFQVAHALLKVP